MNKEIVADITALHKSDSNVANPEANTLKTAKYICLHYLQNQLLKLYTYIVFTPP